VVNPHEHPTALKDLQDSIYREKVLRARAMTPEERMAAGFDITNEAFQRMLHGAMWQLNTEDTSLGWAEVERRLDRLRNMHEHGLYSVERKLPGQSI
jgi:hypothetical protein